MNVHFGKSSDSTSKRGRHDDNTRRGLVILNTHPVRHQAAPWASTVMHWTAHFIVQMSRSWKMLIISRIRKSIRLLIQSIPSLRSRRSRFGRVLVMNHPFSLTTKRKIPHLHQFLLVIGLQKGWINELLLRDVRLYEGLLLA